MAADLAACNTETCPIRLACDRWIAGVTPKWRQTWGSFVPTADGCRDFVGVLPLAPVDSGGGPS